MIKSYFKIALRNLLKNKGFSFINIFGLALSMSVGMIVILFLVDILKSDEFNEKKDQIYRITTFSSSKWGTHTFATSPVPLAQHAHENYAGIEKLVEIRRSSGMVESNDKSLSAQGLYVGNDLFDVFSFKLDQGTPATALSDPFSIILTKKLAIKLFGNTDCLGKIVRLESRGNFVITGILDHKKYKSHFIFEYLISFEAYEILRDQGKLDMSYTITFDPGTSDEEKKAALKKAEWHNYYQNYSYLLLDERISKKDFVKYLNHTAEEYYKDMENHEIAFNIQALDDISPSKGIPPANEIGLTIPTFMIWIFVTVALLVILLAGFNYTNLTIAKSLARAREVGMRKVFGSTRLNISLQFILEAVILSVLSLFIAIGIVEFIIPAIKSIDPGVEDVFNLDMNIKIYLIFLLFGILTGIIAGIIPSLYLSSFKPVRVLKGVIKVRLFAGLTLRKIFLGIQFTFGIIFIMITVLLIKQIHVLNSLDLGFETENRIVIPMQGVDPQLLINEIKSNPNIKNMTMTNNLPVVGPWSNSFVRSIEMEDSIKIHEYVTDPTYLETMGLTLISGRNFTEEDKIGNEKFVMINQKAVEKFGLENDYDAIGKILMVDGRSKEVIGVVKDYYTRPPIETLEPIILRYIPDWSYRMIVEYQHKNKDELISYIETKWNELEQEHPFRYKVVEDEIGMFYMIINTFLIIVLYVSLLIITIASLGMLGMVAFTVRNREKEISIRKVMGASVKKISWILSKDFAYVILISMVIAIPVVYLLATEIQAMVPDSVGFDPVSIIIGLLITLLIAGLTIVVQAHKAARANPADVMRYE